MHVVRAFQGVAVTFAPVILFFAGQGRFFPEAHWFIVPFCFALVYLVPTFYFLFGNSIIAQLRRSGTRQDGGVTSGAGAEQR